MTSALTVGLALSGGGAAALAHVGVLEELIAAGIPIHAVAGTSAGAMVGAAYAADSLEGFRDTMCALTRRRVLWLFDPKWPHSGLLEGRRSLELVRPYLGDRIETLPHPFAAVAADLLSGAEVVLREGNVVKAIRASIAFPGLFTPQRWEGRLLVDGGLVNPVPVDVVRQLGAEFVIAVSALPVPIDSWLHIAPRSTMTAQLLARFLARLNGRPPSPLEAARPLDTSDDTDSRGLIEVLSRATSLAHARIAAGRLREHPPDYFIAVPLPDVGLFDFHRTADAIAAGRTAARQALPELRTALAAAASWSRKVSRWLDDAKACLRGSWQIDPESAVS